MILPALLTSEREVAKERLALARAMGGWLHIDLLDCSLYPFTSLPLEELGRLDFGSLALELHCMIENPRPVATGPLAFQRLVIHHEVADWEAIYHDFTSRGINTWLAVDPETPVEGLELPADLGGLLVMGIMPGQSGLPFQRATYDRLDLLKERYPDLALSVDGGVDEDNLRQIIAHGADHLVMGSAIFEAPDPPAAYHRYLHLSDPLSFARLGDDRPRQEAK